MKLTHYLKEGDQSLKVVVDFDVRTRTVEEVRKVYVVFGERNTYRADITDLLHEYFYNDLDKLLEKIDWMEYVNEEKV